MSAPIATLYEGDNVARLLPHPEGVELNVTSFAEGEGDPVTLCARVFPDLLGACEGLAQFLRDEYQGCESSHP
jgi:hypothetical protein